VEFGNYEATSTLTFVTTRVVTHPAIRGFVDVQKAAFSSFPAIKLQADLPALTLAGVPRQARATLLWARKYNCQTTVYFFANFFDIRNLSEFSKLTAGKYAIE
jgi:hypothetical protein